MVNLFCKNINESNISHSSGLISHIKIKNLWSYLLLFAVFLPFTDLFAGIFYEYVLNVSYFIWTVFGLWCIVVFFLLRRFEKVEVPSTFSKLRCFWRIASVFIFLFLITYFMNNFRLGHVPYLLAISGIFFFINSSLYPSKALIHFRIGVFFASVGILLYVFIMGTPVRSCSGMERLSLDKLTVSGVELPVGTCLATDSGVINGFVTRVPLIIHGIKFPAWTDFSLYEGKIKWVTLSNGESEVFGMNWCVDSFIAFNPNGEVRIIDRRCSHDFTVTFPQGSMYSFVDGKLLSAEIYTPLELFGNLWGKGDRFFFRDNQIDFVQVENSSTINTLYVEKDSFVVIIDQKIESVVLSNSTNSFGHMWPSNTEVLFSNDVMEFLSPDVVRIKGIEFPPMSNVIFLHNLLDSVVIGHPIKQWGVKWPTGSRFVYGDKCFNMVVVDGEVKYKNRIYKKSVFYTNCSGEINKVAPLEKK